MKSWLQWSLILVLICSLSVSLSADDPDPVQPAKDVSTNEKAEQKDIKRLSLKEAQARARLLHNVYSSTLDVMHHHYFREDRSAIPARVMVDIFAELEAEESIQARWISVNAKAMSIDHKPSDEFEKLAARELAKGNDTFEKIEDGVYRRAGAISLMNRGCLGCHLGLGVSAKKDRFAGLVINIPILEE